MILLFSFLTIVSIISGQEFPDFEFESESQNPSSRRIYFEDGSHNHRTGIRSLHRERVAQDQVTPLPLIRRRNNNDLVLTISENGAQSKQSRVEPEAAHNNDHKPGSQYDLESQYDFKSQPLYKPVCFLTPVRNFLRIPQKTVIDHSLKPTTGGGNIEAGDKEVTKQEVKAMNMKNDQKDVYDPNEKVAIDPRQKVSQPEIVVTNQNAGVQSGIQTSSSGRSRSISFDEQSKTEPEERRSTRERKARKNPEIFINENRPINPFLTNRLH